MSKPKIFNFIANTLAFIACLAMVSSPVVHSQIISNNEGGWTWLCTANGFNYINFDSNSNEEPEHSNTPNSFCCLYDAVPKSDTVLLKQPNDIIHVIERLLYRLIHIHSFYYYSSRAPPIFS